MSVEMYVALLSIDIGKKPNFKAGERYLNNLTDKDVLDTCTIFYGCSEYYPYNEEDTEEAEKQKAEATKMRAKLKSAIDWLRDEENSSFLTFFIVGTKEVYITADRTFDNPAEELNYIWVLYDTGIAEAMGFDPPFGSSCYEGQFSLR